MELSPKAVLDTQVDVAKATTVETVSHLAGVYRKGGEVMPTQWIFATVSLLVGFVVHGLVVSQVLKPSTGNAKVDAGLADAVKVGTVLTVSQVINTSMKGSVNLSDAWMKSTAMNLIAFFVFHVLVAERVPSVEGYQATVMDLAKVAFTSVAVQYMSGSSVMDQEYLLSLAGTLAGFAVYHELVHPRVFA